MNKIFQDAIIICIADKTKENYEKIFAACSGHPVYITNYRQNENAGFSDEEIGEELIRALDCGATLGDVSGSLFDSERAR